MQPTIFAVRGEPASGKTTTIGLVFQELEGVGHVVQQPTGRKETTAILIIDGVKSAL